MRILVDCDGVMADFVGAVLRELRMPDAVREELTDFEFFEAIALRSRGYSEEYVRDRVSVPGFCSGISPLPGAVDGIQSLRDAGAQVICVTAWWNSETWCHERAAWLVRHFDFRTRDIVFAKDKSHVWGDALIDDKPENVVDWSTEHGERGLLWDAPYNRQRNLVRMHSWEHVRKELML